MPNDFVINNQKSKTYYKMTWFSIMDMLDEATRFEESDYYMKHRNNNIYHIKVVCVKGLYTMVVNGIKMKCGNNMGEAWVILRGALNYKGGL